MVILLFISKDEENIQNVGATQRKIWTIRRSEGGHVPLNPHGTYNLAIGIGEQLPFIDRHKWFCIEQSSDVGSIHKVHTRLEPLNNAPGIYFMIWKLRSC